MTPDRPRPEEPSPGRRIAILAGFYALYLRDQGYARDEAAQLVLARYPGARQYLNGAAPKAMAPDGLAQPYPNDGGMEI